MMSVMMSDTAITCFIYSEPTHSQSEVIESLKSKLKDQEVQLQKTERPKCLICMVNNDSPVY